MKSLTWNFHQLSRCHWQIASQISNQQVGYMSQAISKSQNIHPSPRLWLESPSLQKGTHSRPIRLISRSLKHNWTKYAEWFTCCLPPNTACIETRLTKNATSSVRCRRSRFRLAPDWSRRNYTHLQCNFNVHYRPTQWLIAPDYSHVCELGKVQRGTFTKKVWICMCGFYS